MTTERLSWPVCDGCEGYGTVLLNQITHQRSNDPCPKCGGGGRMAPPDAVDSAPSPNPEPPKPAYVYSRDEVIALNPIRESQGLPPLPMPEA